MSYDEDVVATAKAGYEVPPAGLNNAVCCGVWNCGLHENPYKDDKSLQTKCALGFELETKYSSGENAGKQMIVFRAYTLNIGSQSNLGKDLEAWRGKKFSDEEREGFTLNNLIGISCTLNINNEGKIEGILPHQEKEPKLKPEFDKTEIPKYVQAIRDKAVSDTAPIAGTKKTKTEEPAVEEKVPF